MIVQKSNENFALTSKRRRRHGAAMRETSRTAKRLKDLRKRSGLTVQEAADAVGMAKSTYASYEDKFKKALLPFDLAQKLAQAFRRNGRDQEASEVISLATGGAEGLSESATPYVGATSATQRSVRGRRPTHGDVTDIPSEGEEKLVAETSGVRIRSDIAPFTGVRDLPILGYAKGGDEGHFFDQGEVSGYTLRPAILAGVKDAYAVEFFDESMEPMFTHGHVGHVHPRTAVKPADGVVIQLKDGQVLVKQLIRRTERELILRQFNPRKDITIPSSKVKAVHLIIGTWRVRT